MKKVWLKIAPWMEDLLGIQPLRVLVECWQLPSVQGFLDSTQHERHHTISAKQRTMMNNVTMTFKTGQLGFQHFLGSLDFKVESTRLWIRIENTNISHNAQVPFFSTGRPSWVVLGERGPAKKTLPWRPGQTAARFLKIITRLANMQWIFMYLLKCFQMLSGMIFRKHGWTPKNFFLKYIVPSLKSFQINPVMLMLLIKILPIPCGDDFIPIHQTIAG